MCSRLRVFENPESSMLHSPLRALCGICARLRSEVLPRHMCRDIKTSNILLNSGGVAKIGDVGLAKVVSNTVQHSSIQAIGTFAYAAPEVLMGAPCTEKVRARAHERALENWIVKHCNCASTATDTCRLNRACSFASLPRYVSTVSNDNLTTQCSG